MGSGASSEAVPAPVVVTPARNPPPPSATPDVGFVSPSGASSHHQQQQSLRRHAELLPLWEYRLGSGSGDSEFDGEASSWTRFSDLDQERLETTRRAFARAPPPPAASASPSSSSAGSVVVLLGRTAWNVYLAQPVASSSNGGGVSANLFGSPTPNNNGGVSNNPTLQFSMSRGSGHNGVVQRRMIEKPDLHAPSPFDELAAPAGSSGAAGALGSPLPSSSGSRADDGEDHASGLSCQIKLESTVKAHGALVYCIDFSGDGKNVLSGSKDGSLRYFDLEGSRVVCDYKPIEEVVLSCAVSPDGRLAVAGSSNCNGYVYRTERRNPRDDSARYESAIAMLSGHKHKVYGVRFTHESRTIVTASMDCAVRTWDPARGFECTRTLVAHSAPIFALATSPVSSNIVLSGGDDNLLVCHDLRTDGRRGATFRGHKQTIWTCDIRCDERQFISASMEGCCLLWDARSNRKPLQVVADHGNFPVHCALFMPEGSMVLTSARDSTWRLWQVHPSLAANVAVGPAAAAAAAEANRGGAQSLDSTGGAALSSSGGSVEDAEALGPQELGRVHASSGNVFKLSYDAIRNRVMSCGSDGLIKIWRLTF